MVFLHKKRQMESPVFFTIEATLRLELRNGAFAEPSLTNLGTSPEVPTIIRNFFLFSKTTMPIICKIAELWLKTLRIDLKMPRDYTPGIFALWHKDLAAATAALRKTGAAALISQSKDGEKLAEIASDLGYRVVRGSSTHGMLQIRELLKELENGYPCAMALDGPKGPALVEKPGTRWLARKSKKKLWQVSVIYGAHFQLHSWDKAVIPLPFSRIHVELQEVSPN